jgi:GT2 family glycosyltransferase
MKKSYLNPQIGIILVTYNDELNLQPFFSSLDSQSYLNFHVYLIDNNSSDDSVSRAKTLFPSIKIRKLEQNLGFAGANNIGAELAISDGCELLYISNNDVELERDCIKELVGLFNRDSELVCAGPIILKGTSANEKNIIQEYGGKIDFFRCRKEKYLKNRSYEKEKKIPEILEVDFIMGGALMIKAEVVQKIGLFDERYFMYNEEVDLFYRIKSRQYKMEVTKKAIIWHNHYSAGNNLKRYYFERYYIVKNMYLYLLKYKFYKNLMISVLKDVFLSPLIYKDYIKRRKFKVFWYQFKGIYDGIRNRVGKSDNIYQ